MKNRALYIGLPVFALLVGLVGARVVASLQGPGVAPTALPAAATAPVMHVERPASATAAAAAAPSVATEPAPAAAPVKSATATKVKARVPTRKKGHDFGF